MTADVQRELVEALRDKLVETVGSQMPRGHVWNLDTVTDGLLPLIADAEKRAAAAALRDLASDLGRCEDAPTDAALEGLDFTLRTLRYRADDLDPSGAAEGTGR